jgi:pyruvate dehydrogenase (quinone)
MIHPRKWRCPTRDDPDNAADVLKAAFEAQGPAVVQAVIDPNEAALPGHVTMDQAWRFARSLVRGEKDRWAIIKYVLKEQVREVV